MLIPTSWYNLYKLLLTSFIHIPKAKENSIKFQTPPNCGWIEYKLNDETVQHVWTCIEQTQGNQSKPTLVGQIDSSFQIQDIDDTTVASVYMHDSAQRL